MEIPRLYRKPLLFAVSLHVLLVVVLIIKLPNWSYQYRSGRAKTKIVHATAVTSTSVQKEIRDIKYREEAEQRREQRKLAELRHQAAVEQRRQREAAKHVAEMKQQQLRLKQQHAKQLAALKEIKLKAVLAQKQAALAKKARIAAAKAAEAKKKEMLKLAQQKLLAQQLSAETNNLQKLQSQQMRGIVDKYKALILSAIGQQWLVPDGVNKQLSCIYEVHLAPGGTVLSVSLVRSSGNTALDQSAKTAIYKASPLPVPKDNSAFDSFRDIRLTVSPKQVIRS